MKWTRPIAFAALAGALLLLPRSGSAADDPGVIPLRIVEGESVPVGPGPVRTLICDDPSLVQPTEVDGVPAFRGIKVGTTLCSLTDVLSVRRIYRVVVVGAGSSTGGSPSKPGGG
jgi:hypothetical protein